MSLISLDYVQAQLQTVREECERKIVMLREGEKQGRFCNTPVESAKLSTTYTCSITFHCCSEESGVQRENKRLQGLLEKMR